MICQKWLGDIILQAVRASVHEKRQMELNVKRRKRRGRKNTAEQNAFDPDSDERFAYIAGYTAGGLPYGITWEEMEDQESAQTLGPDGSRGQTEGGPHDDIPF
jgi:hypothetical protein